MSVKHYCDKCDEQLGLEEIGKAEFTANFQMKGIDYLLTVIMRRADTSVDFELCANCLRDFVAKTDKRPKQANHG